jgi:SAM-dependent methyltransferase
MDHGLLQALLERRLPPQPWQEGEKIPWDEAGFSRRMLQEHLSQAHDAASRRLSTIDQQVDWIHQEILARRPSRILDLCCGPGLYGTRLNNLGHRYTGIDFSPASIEHARGTAAAREPGCAYLQADVRHAEFGDGYDLAMLIFGEFNAFRRSDAVRILEKTHRALRPGGILLLEPHTLAAVRAIGGSGRRWYTAVSGLWSDGPFLCLEENFWDEFRQAATTRFFVLEGRPEKLHRFSASMQGYSREGYEQLLAESGFSQVRVLDGFRHHPGDPQAEYYVVLAQAGPTGV